MSEAPHTAGTPRADPPGAHANRALWWQVYPPEFTGADPSGRDSRPAGGLAHITEWLDYVVDLGLTGLQLGPIFASSTHGYDTVDHYRIDARLGEDDFRALITAAHERGLAVLLDGVFNHVGRNLRPSREPSIAGRAALEAN